MLVQAAAPGGLCPLEGPEEARLLAGWQGKAWSPQQGRRWLVLLVWEQEQELEDLARRQCLTLVVLRMLVVPHTLVVIRMLAPELGMHMDIRDQAALGAETDHKQAQEGMGSLVVGNRT